jgi:cholesterol transport system auxiliary component
MNPLCLRVRSAAALAAVVLCTQLASCALLGNKPAPPLRTYALETLAPTQATTQAIAAAASKLPSRRVLLVQVPQAAPGYDSAHMVYTRQPQTQEVFANSVWVDTPARMLAPLLVTQLQHSADLRAVLLAPSAAKAGLRLDTTNMQLHQDFLQQPSILRLSFTVTLSDNHTREVLAWRSIDVARNAPSDDAAGGAVAAQAAAREALQQVQAFVETKLQSLPTSE